MSEQTPQEHEIAILLVECLDLEDVEPSEIKADAALFGASNTDSLGLDSIDALEIALALAQKYDIHIKAEDENNKQVFSSLKSLTSFVFST